MLSRLSIDIEWLGLNFSFVEIIHTNLLAEPLKVGKLLKHGLPCDNFAPCFVVLIYYTLGKQKTVVRPLLDLTHRYTDFVVLFFEHLACT